MNFDDALKEWVPIKYKCDREWYCRAYVKEQARAIREAQGFATTEEELYQIAANQIAVWKRDGLPAHEGQQLAAFHEVERKRRRTEKAQKGGFAKAEAARKKKLLARVRKRKPRT